MIYIFFATGFEEIEALTVVDVLRRAELQVKTVSIGDALLVRGAHNVGVQCDMLLSDGDFAEADLLVLPGGMPGASNLADSEKLSQILLRQHAERKPLAAICAAPLVLGRLDILQGEVATCYPSFESELRGAIVSTDGVVVSHHITTGKGPAFALDFALQLVTNLCGKPAADDIRRGMLLM